MRTRITPNTDTIYAVRAENLKPLFNVPIQYPLKVLGIGLKRINECMQPRILQLQSCRFSPCAFLWFPVLLIIACNHEFHDFSAFILCCVFFDSL